MEIFYTAAVLLQERYGSRLARLFGEQPRLPDYFSQALGIEPDPSVETVLTRLAGEHKRRRQLDLNWTATYEHAAETWMRAVELQVERGERHLWQAA